MKSTAPWNRTAYWYHRGTAGQFRDGCLGSILVHLSTRGIVFETTRALEARRNRWCGHLNTLSDRLMVRNVVHGSLTCFSDLGVTVAKPNLCCCIRLHSLDESIDTVYHPSGLHLRSSGSFTAELQRSRCLAWIAGYRKLHASGIILANSPASLKWACCRFLFVCVVVPIVAFSSQSWQYVVGRRYLYVAIEYRSRKQSRSAWS